MGTGAWRYYVPYRWSGLLPASGRSAPGARLPGGVPISPEKWGERGPGASPLDPDFFIAARSHSLILGIIVFGAIVGLFLPVY